jgi:hypothetical protein
MFRAEVEQIRKWCSLWVFDAKSGRCLKELRRKFDSHPAEMWWPSMSIGNDGNCGSTSTLNNADIFHVPNTFLHYIFDRVQGSYVRCDLSLSLFVVQLSALALSFLLSFFVVVGCFCRHPAWSSEGLVQGVDYLVFVRAELFDWFCPVATKQFSWSNSG